MRNERSFLVVLFFTVGLAGTSKAPVRSSPPSPGAATSASVPVATSSVPSSVDAKGRGVVPSTEGWELAKVPRHRIELMIPRGGKIYKSLVDDGEPAPGFIVLRDGALPSGRKWLFDNIAEQDRLAGNSRMTTIKRRLAVDRELARRRQDDVLFDDGTAFVGRWGRYFVGDACGIADKREYCVEFSTNGEMPLEAIMEAVAMARSIRPMR